MAFNSELFREKYSDTLHDLLIENCFRFKKKKNHYYNKEAFVSLGIILALA